MPLPIFFLFAPVNSDQSFLSAFHSLLKQQRIPPDFVKYITGALPYKSTITSQEKRSWLVELKKVDGHLYLQEGWQQFVHDNSLEFGDFLLFYYGGNAQFYVKIYGKNNCLKKVSEPTREIFREITHPQDNQTVERRKSKRLAQGANDVEITHKELFPRSSLATQEGNRAHKEASKFVSEFPFFKVAMSASYSNGNPMNIPATFHNRYMEKGTDGAKLVVSDRSWPVKLSKPSRGGAPPKVKRQTRLPGKEVVDDDTPTSKKLSKTVSATSRNKGRGEIAETKDENAGRQATKKKRSTTDRGVGKKIKEARKAEVNEGEVRETAFRSSLGGIMKIIKELNLRESHKRVLKMTPFWAIFEAIIDNKVSPTQCRKSDKMIIEIIETFDPDEGKFRVGKRGQLLDLTKEDMVSYFGIQCGEEFVSLQYGCKEAVRFVMRREIVDKRLTTKSLKQLLSKYVGSDEKDDVEDVARLLCLYLLHTFFFPMGINVKWVLFERVDDLERMRRYDWNGAIIKELMSSIKKYHKEPRKVSGCVMALLYWLCEHTTLTKALHPEHPLGIVKWSIPELVNKFKRVWIKDLKRKQVVSVVANVTKTSGDEEQEEKYIVHDTLPPGDVKISNKSNTPYSDDGLRYEENIPSLSNSRGNVEGCVPDSAEHVDNTPVGCGISSVQVQDELSFQDYKDSPADDDNASMVKELRAQIALLEKHIKDKDDMHKREIEIKDVEIAILNEKILSLIAEGSQLWDESADTLMHAVTQSDRQVPKDEQEQCTLVRHAKEKKRKGTEKKRKGTEKEEYVYPLPSKHQRVVPSESDGKVNKEMIDVDTYELGPKKPGSKCADIIHAFLSDELHSWNPQQQMDQVEQAVEAEEADKKPSRARTKK
ncbi:hypothetical protein Vadar_025700 [Vaccinium darrowii]|uniref:Uncharacterized protein n=1 Tax=Vaccinium darrowii TaxID=229202 RepID=A0ACB7YH57_9ERIC|nr:hypothetical protein Vadar_025700 [Vaccinium darrowii]